MSVLRTEGLGVDFGQPVLRDVSIDVPAGQFVALMGANGTGKTTLVRSVLGLLRPTTGAVWLFDTPLEHFRDWTRVSYVPQRLVTASAVPLSVEEAVRSALTTGRSRLRPVSRAQRARVHEALEQVGMADRAKDRLEDLSGGQQRRVMVARALTTDAELMIMDEPTAGIDAGEQVRPGAAAADRERVVAGKSVDTDGRPDHPRSGPSRVIGTAGHCAGATQRRLGEVRRTIAATGTLDGARVASQP